jgi:hypothetical protein
MIFLLGFFDLRGLTGLTEEGKADAVRARGPYSTTIEL